MIENVFLFFCVAFIFILYLKLQILRKKNKKLQMLSHVDGLTGLFNYTAFQSQISLLSAKKSSAAVLFIDVDGFKLINDLHGHSFGNECLQLIAKLLRENLRKTDFLARYGGDEFVVLLDAVNEIEAEVVVNRLRMIFSSIDSGRGSISVSMGVVFSSLEKEDLIALADRALYKEKEQKKIRNSGMNDEKKNRRIAFGRKENFKGRSTKSIGDPKKEQKKENW